jgi:hypothetical protein
MLRVVGLLTWLRREPSTRAEPGPRARLRPGVEVIERYRAEGADPAAALRGARQQLEGLRHELDDDDGWARLVRLARQAGDPWNAYDWPLGFDALICAASLCAHVSFECTRCPVGRRQDGRSCAHPESAFGRIGGLVREGRREALREHLDALERLLEQARSDPP